MVDTPTLKEKVCGCGVAFTYVPFFLDGRERFVEQRRCKTCDAALVRDRAAEEKEELLHKMKWLWEDICPPLYRETDPDRLNIKSLPQILAWEPSPMGIGLTGKTGSGKTRAMFLLLKSLHFASKGSRVMATSAKRFEHWCHRMFDKETAAREKLQEAHTIPVLFIDDIGKEKYTERVESEFYDLIEYRTSHLLPILWTANATGEQLVNMMGADRGTPIVRRLREFSTIISV